MFSRFFIDRPIFATVISVVITLAGFVAVLNLPIAQYPDVTPPTVQVTAVYPGANAYTLRDTVAAPIEEQVSGVEGMLYMSSQCTNNGTYTLTVTFRLGMDSDMAQVLVQNRVSLALPVIPDQVRNEGITVKKQSPNTLLIVNLYGDKGAEKDDYVYLSNYATIYIKDVLAREKGVAGISYLGQADYSLRAWLDPDRLAALNLNPTDVVTAIAQQNIQVAAGQVGQQPAPKIQQFQLTINTQGRLTTPEEFGNIIVKAGGGAPGASPAISATDSQGGAPGTSDTGTLSTGIVRLRNLVTTDERGEPRVEMVAQQYDTTRTMDGRKSVALSIYQLPGSNALDVANKIRRKMRDLERSFPDGLHYQIVYDTTPFIRESVQEVFTTLRDAVLLVAIVVLLFLQDWRAMILPMIDVPVSLIGTFAVMALLGFTLNNLTLFGLVLAIGIVVDDAIVVLENIERQMARGLDARSATIKAMDEITGPILAITLVLSSVFLPVCFLGGISGQFFRQFAVTISVSTIISAINAITMTPSRAVLIFKTEEGHNGHEHKREALPWWFFGILGGILAVELVARYLAGPVGLPTFANVEEGDLGPRWAQRLVITGSGLVSQDQLLPEEIVGYVDWVITVVYFLPGLLIGLVVGWLTIRPVNAALGWFFRGFNRLFDHMTLVYGRVVGWVLSVSLVVLVVYGVLLALTGWEFLTAPTGFVPQQDKGYLILNVELQDAASLSRTEAMMVKINRQILGDKVDNPKQPAAIAGVNHTVGVSGQSLISNAIAPNLGSMYVMLDEFSKRSRSADDIARDVVDRVQAKVPGAIVHVFGGPPIEGLGTTGGFKLILEAQSGSSDLTKLQESAKRIVAEGNQLDQQVPGLKGLFSTSRENTPWLSLDVNRDKCMALGVPVSDVFSVLQIYLGSYYVNNFNEFGRTWQVIVQADERFRDKVRDVRRLQVRNQQGMMVPLGTLLEIHNVDGPVSVMRYNMYAATAITGEPTRGTSTGQATALMQELADKEKANGMAWEWTELNLLQQGAGGTANFVFGLAVLFVFLVLAAQYESWSLPLAVILVVPMCLLSSITGVLLAGLEINIFTQIGFVVLVGLASKNAILIVEFAKQRQEEGVPRREAALEGSQQRLRPILMTSFAFILGVLPLILHGGAGAEMRRDLGLAVFSGMLGVTFFGVFLTPVFFYTVRRFSERPGGHQPAPPLTETRPGSPASQVVAGQRAEAIREEETHVRAAPHHAPEARLTGPTPPRTDAPTHELVVAPAATPYQPPAPEPVEPVPEPASAAADAPETLVVTAPAVTPPTAGPSETDIAAAPPDDAPPAPADDLSQTPVPEMPSENAVETATTVPVPPDEEPSEIAEADASSADSVTTFTVSEPLPPTDGSSETQTVMPEVPSDAPSNISLVVAPPSGPTDTYTVAAPADAAPQPPTPEPPDAPPSDGNGHEEHPIDHPGE